MNQRFARLERKIESAGIKGSDILAKYKVYTQMVANGEHDDPALKRKLDALEAAKQQEN